jgi:hypothetical protein
VIVVALIVVCLAGVSLLLPWEPVYDPWGWLVWGRETADLALDTSSGPSWKPLPVLFTTAFSAVPEIAPELWLFVTRAGWLAAVALAALLAVRLAARRGAGIREQAAAAAIAALAMLLLADDFTPWLRQFAGGLSEPLLAALVLAAVERGLAGRSGAALALAGVAALIRPEAWPFLALYVAWLWRREPALRGAGVALIAGIGALWVVPDLLGSGSALTGAERAREGSGSPPVEALEVLARAAILPIAVAWAGFALALADARRRGDQPVVVVAAAALGWIGVVAVMAAGGYAGLPRFVVPAVGVVCALGASGLVSVAARAFDADGGASRDRNALRALTAALAFTFVLQAGVRAADLGDAARSATELGAAHEDLRRIVEDAGKERMRVCQPVVLDAIEGQTAMAWRMEVPIGAIDVAGRRPGRGLYLDRGSEGWEARKLGCPNVS